MKKITQKLFVLLVAVLMVVATGVGRVHAETKSTDVGTLTVNGLDKPVNAEEGEEVTFYKIAAVTYNGDNPNLAADWTYANPTVKEKILALLGQPDGERDYEQFINEMAQGILGNTITPIGEPKVLRDSDHNGTIKWETTYRDATAEDVTNGLAENVGDPVSNNDGPKPGIYIARVTDAEGAKIYNPALLTVLYNSDLLENGTVTLADKYANSATLKSSEPGSDKAIKGNNNDDQNRVVYDDTKPSAIGPKGTNAKDEYDEDNDEWETVSDDNNLGAKTVSVGDKIDYEAEIAIPEYPKNAKDQTIWFRDTMEKGLTFDSTYFTMKLEDTSGYSKNVDIASTPDTNGDRELSVTQTGTFYEENENADPAYYLGSDGNYYQDNVTPPTGVTIDTENGTKYELKTSKKFVIGKIKFAEGAPNGGFTAVITDYNALRELLALDSRNPSGVVIRLDYSAILNEKAVVGVVGNKNKLTYVYSNEPSQGQTHITTDEAKNRKREEDQEIVYTYEVSILKTDVAVEEPFKTVVEYREKSVDEGDDVTGLFEETETDVYTVTTDTTAVASKTYYEQVEIKKIKTEQEIRDEYSIPATTKVFLPGAEFDVYDGPKATGKLIGHVVTNPNGIATLSDVAKGTYYFYETKAPAGGYSFDPNEAHKVEATWTSCTWTNSYSDEEIRYTSEKKQAVNTTQVGWIKGGKYYEMTALNYYVDETNGTVYADDTREEVISDVYPAYIKSHETSSSSTTQTLTNPQKAGGGVAVLQVKNSKNPTLPSTGGIGTYLFTIAGVAIIATAAFMLIFRKKEGHTH